MTEEALAQARLVAAEWGEPTAAPRLISARENHVFAVSYPDKKAALRLHRPHYVDEAALLSELTLMRDLAAAGLAVPAAIPTLTGALLARTPTRLASLITWCEGRPFGSGAEPLADPLGQMAALGETIARLHLCLDTLTLPAGFTRHRWDLDGLLGESPTWGRFWDSPALTLAERDYLLAFREAAAKALADIGDFGLIHADLLRENILVAGETPILIDFDDCGFGYRLFDLGTALVQSLHDRDLPSQIEALTRGYTALRPLGGTRHDLTLMMALRLCASVGWFASRAPATDSGHRERVSRALRAVRLWQSGGAF